MRWNKSKRLCLAVAVGIALVGTAAATGTGSAFTYQGRLTDGASVANGEYDLRFTLRDDPTGGAQVGSTITNTAVAISNGLFAVTLDFGANVFDGSGRWLEIGVRQGANPFTTLAPRQALTPVPYAVTAMNIANPVTNFSGTFTGSFAGDGAALTNLNTSAVTAATNALWAATTNWVSGQGYQTTNTATRAAISAPAATGQTNFVVDFAAEVAAISATNHIYLLQSTNRPAAGWYGECVWYIQGGTTNWTLRFNTNWTAVGTLATNTPFVIVSNKLTIVALAARGSSETNVSYAIARQE